MNPATSNQWCLGMSMIEGTHSTWLHSCPPWHGGLAVDQLIKFKYITHIRNTHTHPAVLLRTLARALMKLWCPRTSGHYIQPHRLQADSALQYTC